MSEDQQTLSWQEITEYCSRLHTTRRRPEGPWSDAQLREDARALVVSINGSQAKFVPTRLHEPGFYVVIDDCIRHTPEQLRELELLADAGLIQKAEPLHV